MSKFPSSRFLPSRRFTVVFAVALVVTLMAFFFKPMDEPVRSPHDEETFQRWANSGESNIECIVIHPLRGGSAACRTIDKVVTVTDRRKIIMISRSLHSDRLRQHYLDGYEHWGARDYVKLEIRLQNQNSIFFAVNWYPKRPVCSFGLMRDGSDSQRYTGNIHTERADDRLPDVLADIFVKNHVSWVGY
jgi:hypothetical protein